MCWPMTLGSALSARAPAAASAAAAALTEAALASCKAAPGAGVRLGRAGRPPMPIVATSLATRSGIHSLPGSRRPPAGVAATSSLDVAFAPGLEEGGLGSSLPPPYGRPPSPAAADSVASATPVGTRPSPPTAADDAPSPTLASAATSSSSTVEDVLSLAPVDTASCCVLLS